jgi:hypothetical protein
MARYRANVKVGPWHRGDVFESTDPHHAVLAASGNLTVLDGPVDPEEDTRPSLLGVPEPQPTLFPDGASEGG